MTKKFKEKLTLSEQLLLDSMQLTTVCPKCGRAVLVTSKDLYWTFGMIIVHENGHKEKHDGGWRAECKCGYPIKIKISMEAEK